MYNPVKLKVKKLKIKSKSQQTYTHPLIRRQEQNQYIALTSFLVFWWVFFKSIVSIKAREIHFKRGQSEYYVGVAMVQVSNRYMLQKPDDILKHPLGSLPLVIVSKCHRVSVANQQKNIRQLIQFPCYSVPMYI